MREKWDSLKHKQCCEKRKKEKKEVTEKKCFLSKTQSLKTIMFESGENNEKRRW